MKVLLYDWTESRSHIYKRDIWDTFNKMGIKYDSFLFDFERQDFSELEDFFSDITSRDYDFCFSINYFPELSSMCHKHGIKYIVWGYDCPFNVINIEDTLGNLCNYVFCFDRIQAESYWNQGFDTVYHLPLGVNVDRYKKVNPSAAQCEKFAAQVGFIGSLYEGQYSAIAEICDEYTMLIVK